MYAADLTEKHVDYNKGDVTDPTTLGGMNVLPLVLSIDSK